MPESRNVSGVGKKGVPEKIEEFGEKTKEAIQVSDDDSFDWEKGGGDDGWPVEPEHPRVV